MKRKKTAFELIESALRRGPKRGLTVATLAGRTGLSPSTVSKTLQSIEGVAVIGNVQTGRRGRPANLYALAA